MMTVKEYEEKYKKDLHEINQKLFFDFLKKMISFIDTFDIGVVLRERGLLFVDENNNQIKSIFREEFFDKYFNEKNLKIENIKNFYFLEKLGNNTILYNSIFNYFSNLKINIPDIKYADVIFNKENKYDTLSLIMKEEFAEFEKTIIYEKINLNDINKVGKNYKL